ncbi:MAG: phage tail protein [Gemmatimonadaceae bacterium]
MTARDANGGTWYMLRWGRDFAPRPATATDPVPPALDASLFWDDDRATLELLPKPPARPIAPLPGLAVEPGGAVYRVAPESGTLLARDCDGTERPIPCESHVLARPAGLALDRRGLLYVADPAARRVVVLLPDDGSVRDVLASGLREPVDVAVSPAGRIYVADRAAGAIVIFNARHTRRGRFAARNAEGLPATPRPIAVMVDADGTVLVADASHPRLLRFTALGEPLADVQLPSALATLGDAERDLGSRLAAGAAPADALLALYGDTMPSFAAGTCARVGECAPPVTRRDGATRLAAVHRALRLLRLRLGRAFQSFGTFTSAALDSGTLDTTWHRIDVDADIPGGSSLLLQTWTENDLAAFTAGPERWTAPLDERGRPVPVTGALPEQLVQSEPGRYLRLRLTVISDGSTTPSVRALRVIYPRVSYLDLLPRVYRRDAEGARFLERFLALFERRLTGIEDRYERFSIELDPDAAPADVLDWLASLINLTFDPSWPVERRRALVAAAMELYRARGTPAGLARYVEIYTGIAPVILERFLERPARAALLGRAGSPGAGGLPTAPPSAALPPDEQLYAEYAHRFTVLVYLLDPCDAEALLPVVDRIVELNKPAHTVHALRAIYPDARVGVQSSLGLDFVLGGRDAAGTRLGGCPVPGEPQPHPAILGHTSVLGERRPGYLRERELGL